MRGWPTIHSGNDQDNTLRGNAGDNLLDGRDTLTDIETIHFSDQILDL